MKLKVKARVLVPQLKKKRGITKFDDCEAKDSDFKSKDKSFVRHRDWIRILSNESYIDVAVFFGVCIGLMYIDIERER